MLQRYKQPSFSGLKEQLLQAGIAPRHVRRYIRELDDHFSDLVVLQKERGYDEPDASLRARALLGEDGELTDAMLATGKFRALSARAPWLVLGIVPSVVIVGGMIVLGVLLVAASAPPHGPNMPLPLWWREMAKIISGVINYSAGPAAMAFVLTTAWRQRLSGFWPVLGFAGAMIMGVITTTSIGVTPDALKGEVSVNMGVRFPDILQETRFLILVLLAATGFGLWFKRRSLA